MKVMLGALLFCFFNMLPRASFCSDASTKAQEKRIYTLEEKVGQLFLIGFQGTEFDKKNQERLEKINPGGLLFFKRNIPVPTRAAQLVYQMKDFNFKKKRLPLLTAIDQEGGVVVRIKTRPPLPSALALGRIQNKSLIHSIGKATAEKLLGIGFNMNLAPVLDLSNPNKKSFIGNRSFGEDPVTTATAASLFAKGLQESKVLATAKHFPGHGNVSSDSHVELPYSNLEKEELFKSYLVPYQKLIESKNISAVMMAHMAYPKIDEVYPATYSKKIISMLRDELGFQGIIMTDDIQMIGANIYSSIAERAVQALLAGNDMIMVAWNFPDQYDAFTGVLEAVKSGKIPESRIDESFNRILKAKESFGLFEAPEPPKPQRVIAEIDDPLLKRDIHSVFTDLMEQEQIKNQKLVLENLEKKPLVVISPDEAFLKSFKTSKLGRKILTIRFKKSFSLENLLQYQKRGKSFTGIYHVTGPGSANQAENIPSQLRSSFILVNNFYPGAVSAADSYKAVIDIPLRNASMGPTLVSWLQSKFVAQAELSSAE